MLSLAALLLFYMSAPTPVPAQEDVDPMIVRVAGDFRETIGTPPVTQMRVTGARGEGRTLILNVDLLDGSSALFRAPQVASSIAIGICAVSRTGNFFGRGRVLRVEVTRVGRAEGSATVDRCPGPAGQGLTAATFAGGMQSMVGTEVSGMTIAAVRAEGNATIVTLAFPAGTPVTDSSQAFLEGFCRRPEELAVFFGNGWSCASTPRSAKASRCPVR
jgi:hypothetical protein